MIRPTKFEIVCDGCGETYRDLMGSEWSDPWTATIDAKEHGWAYVDDFIEPTHYCPKCRKERGL